MALMSHRIDHSKHIEAGIRMRAHLQQVLVDRLFEGAVTDQVLGEDLLHWELM